jgi:hypothetical protein
MIFFGAFEWKKETVESHLLPYQHTLMPLPQVDLPDHLRQRKRPWDTPFYYENPQISPRQTSTCGPLLLHLPLPRSETGSVLSSGTHSEAQASDTAQVHWPDTCWKDKSTALFRVRLPLKSGFCMIFMLSKGRLAGLLSIYLESRIWS